MHTLPCVSCNTPFQTKRPTRKYCSDCYSHRRQLTTRLCPVCNQSFVPATKQSQKYCSILCRPSSVQHQTPLRLPTSTVGTLAELLISSDLIRKGYAVFRALSPACYCDMIAIKDSFCWHIEARTGYQRNGRWFFPPKYHPAVNCLALWDKETDAIAYLTPGTREPLQML